ncbi:MAG: restriction endonuclease subunit S [Proteobacteria bacterium]|nr:restriction endonuclease subunit S [Pseudomonadota bacterium]
MIWPQVQLAPSLARVVRGVTFSQADATDAPFDGGVPVLRAGNIQQRLITDRDLVWVNRAFVGGDQYLQRNDIVVCTSSGSATLVGKSAILEEEFEGTWGAFNAVVRCRPEVLLPQYLAFWLSSEGFRFWKDRQVQGANIQNIRQSAIESIRLPLPPLPEQQRIVDVLQEVAALCEAKQRAISLCENLGKALFEEHFGIAGASTLWPMEPFGKHTTYSKYGPRFPDQPYSDTGIHVLRTTDMNADGTIRWWEAPKLALTEKQIREHALKPGTLVISRSGTIGPFALFDGKEDQCVAGAYLIEFGLGDSIEPEYVRALFSTPYIQQMLRKAVRSVAQPNINAPNIQAIPIPVPPRDRQVAFSKHVSLLREWTKQVVDSAGAFDSFAKAVVEEAFSGDLTSQWRQNHSEEIAEATRARGTLLRERGSGIALSLKPAATTSVQAEPAVRPARHWLLGELSDFQRQILDAFTTYCQASGEALLVEDADVFALFCDDAMVAERLQPFGTSHGNRIRRSLSQLAALGLIAKVTMPKDDPETGERDYLKAFRPLRSDEFTRMADMQTLHKVVSTPTNAQRYYFHVQLDHEVSERAGADGMFQVISLEDGNGKDYTQLVEQGRHYASLDQLNLDLAAALKVPAAHIELEAE